MNEIQTISHEIFEAAEEILKKHKCEDKYIFEFTLTGEDGTTKHKRISKEELAKKSEALIKVVFGEEYL